MTDDKKINSIYIPTDVFEKLRNFCNSNEYGMCILGSEQICIVLIGEQGMSLEITSLAAARMLISSTITTLVNPGSVDESIEKEKVN